MNFFIWHCTCGGNLFYLAESGDVLCASCQEWSTDLGCYEPAATFMKAPTDLTKRADLPKSGPYNRENMPPRA
jgi:uncharacterized Zn finger protein (UPF0148 family)